MSGPKTAAQRPKTSKHLRTPPAYKGDPEKRLEFQRKKEAKRARKRKAKSKQVAGK